MTADRDLDRQLGSWFDDRATARAPDGLLERSLEQVAVTHQRPSWLVRDGWRAPRAMGRPARVPARVGLLLALAVAVVVVATGAGLFLRLLPATNGGPSTAPSTSAAPSSSPTPSPSPTAEPKPAVFVFNKGAGSSAECGGAPQGGCISRLWVANLDGTGAHELIPDQSGCQRFQAWSPDGTHMLFSRSECRWNGEAGMIGAERFYLTDASGSEPQLVDTGCVSPCQTDDHGVFSSDGDRILFLRWKIIDAPPSATPDPVTGKPAPATEVKVLASIDLSTGQVTELGVFDQCDRCGTEWPRTDPRWSPDRTQIVFTWAAPTFGPLTPGDPPVFVADADGKNVHKVSPAGGAPSWSPDGTRIVLQIDRYEKVTQFEYRLFQDIYTIRPDGTDVRRLTTDEISSNPGWSVDGRIWFIRTPRVNGNQQTEGPAQYWVMDANGSHATQLSGPPQPQDLADAALQPAP
jgi:dipeptidyl aminopeptidase/acylaminoacyl peptidase